MGDDDIHCTVDVRSCVVPSEKTPVAVTKVRAASGRFSLEGLMLIDTGVALLTVMVAAAVCPANCAVICVVPRPIACSNSSDPTTAIVGLVLDQTALVVIS